MGRACLRNKVKYGSWDGAGWGTGIALPDPTQPYRTPGTPLPPGYTSPPDWYSAAVGYGAVPQCNMAVGLKSVAQLSLYVRFSGFQGMTEGYNLSEIGRINNH